MSCKFVLAYSFHGSLDWTHLVTYLDVCNFCDKSAETTLHETCVQVFLRFSDSSKPSHSVSLIYEIAWLAGINKSEENLLKTSCKVAPVTKVAYMFWWSHDNRKQSSSGRERWCDVSCDIPYSYSWMIWKFILQFIWMVSCFHKYLMFIPLLWNACVHSEHLCKIEQ